MTGTPRGVRGQFERLRGKLRRLEAGLDALDELADMLDEDPHDRISAAEYVPASAEGRAPCRYDPRIRRVSVVPNDPGFTEYPYDYEVTLDGVALDDVVTADVDLGLVYQYYRGVDGEIKYSRDGTTAAVQVLTGHVEISIVVSDGLS